MRVVESPPRVVVPLRVRSALVASRDVSSRLTAVASKGPRRDVLLLPSPIVVAERPAPA